MMGLRVNMNTQNINKSGYVYTVQQKVGWFWKNPNEGKLMLMTVTTYIIKLLLL